MHDHLGKFGLDAEATRTRLLLAIADDTLVTGHTASRLAATEPDDPNGPQFVRLGTEALTHAATWFHVLVAGADLPEDEVAPAIAGVAMGRPVDGYSHAVCCETRPRTFAHRLTRHWLYEHADALRLVSLTESADQAIAAAAVGLLDAKRVQLDHATTWVQRFASEAGGVDLLLAGLRDEWPSAFEFFEEIVGEADAVAEGLLPVPHAVLLRQWLELMVPAMHELGLSAVVADGLEGPAWDGALELVPMHAGRRGDHTKVWIEQLWPEISQRAPA